MRSDFSLNNPRYYTVDPMLSPWGNPFTCHEEVLYLRPMIPPKNFDIFPPGCSEGLDAFRIFFKHYLYTTSVLLRYYYCLLLLCLILSIVERKI